MINAHELRDVDCVTGLYVENALGAEALPGRACLLQVRIWMIPMCRRIVTVWTRAVTRERLPVVDNLKRAPITLISGRAILVALGRSRALKPGLQVCDVASLAVKLAARREVAVLVAVRGRPAVMVPATQSWVRCIKASSLQPY